MSQKFRAAIEKFNNGDSLTDEELKYLAAKYVALCDALDDMYHVEYRLVQRDAWQKRDRLLEIQKARRKA